MANWCSNTLAFEGNETALEQIKSKFRRMINLERSEQCGQLPDFVNPKVGGYFFDIIWDEGDCIFNYQTKWSPHTDILIQIAKRHNVDFIHDYEEMGNLTEIGLDNDDFEQYHVIGWTLETAKIQDRSYFLRLVKSANPNQKNTIRLKICL